MIYRVATNHCLDLLLSKTMAHAAAPALTLEEPQRLEDLLADRELVRKLVAQAEPREAEVATLHYLNGLDQGEAAEVLGVSRRTVVARLAAFLTRARAWVKEGGEA